jgi:hypothetical protein
MAAVSARVEPRHYILTERKPARDESTLLRLQYFLLMMAAKSDATRARRCLRITDRETTHSTAS